MWVTMGGITELIGEYGLKRLQLDGGEDQRSRRGATWRERMIRAGRGVIHGGVESDISKFMLAWKFRGLHLILLATATGVTRKMLY